LKISQIVLLAVDAVKPRWSRGRILLSLSIGVQGVRTLDTAASIAATTSALISHSTWRPWPIIVMEAAGPRWLNLAFVRAADSNRKVLLSLIPITVDVAAGTE
jgi:hypothetical protein